VGHFLNDETQCAIVNQERAKVGNSVASWVKEYDQIEIAHSDSAICKMIS
jgi:hypothetical protein